MTTILDNAEAHRWEIFEGDELAGIVDYQVREGALALTHTETMDGHGGKGIARQLVTAVLTDLRRRGLGVLPYCPYIRTLIADNPEEWLDLVPAEARGKFDLPPA